jgi:hypothetical protein
VGVGVGVGVGMGVACWRVGVLACWRVGVLACWCVGCWCVGVLVCWRGAWGLVWWCDECGVGRVLGIVRDMCNANACSAMRGVMRVSVA